MSIDWRQGVTSTVVAGGIAILTSMILHHFGTRADLTSALAIGLGIGASRLVVQDKGR